MKKPHLRLRFPDEGYDVFAPREGKTWGYRYGPSIMQYGDGRIDAWFASPGGGGVEADWFTYRHSDDYGRTWSDETVVLSPTPDSMDLFSVCDPAVILIDGWYYMGYTVDIRNPNTHNTRQPIVKGVVALSYQMPQPCHNIKNKYIVNGFVFLCS